MAPRTAAQPGTSNHTSPLRTLVGMDTSTNSMWLLVQSSDFDIAGGSAGMMEAIACHPLGRLTFKLAAFVSMS